MKINWGMVKNCTPVLLYNRKLYFLLYKKPPAGCALRRTMMMSQAVYVPFRSLLNERHRRSATPQALECAKAHSLFWRRGKCDAIIIS